MTLSSKIKAVGAETFRVALLGAAVASATLITFKREDGGTTAVIRTCDGKIAARTDWQYELKLNELAQFILINTGARAVHVEHVKGFWETVKIERLCRAAGV